MQAKGKSSEEEMISEWLKAEFWSPRFGKPIRKVLRQLKLSQNLLNHPNLNKPIENQKRKEVLWSYRQKLLTDFPQNISWEKISLSPEDLQKIKYINYDYWVNLSDDSRLPAAAIKNINQGVRIFNQSNQPFIKAAKYLTKHGFFPKLILIATQPRAQMVVLEGHLRLTAFLMEPAYMPLKLEAIIGYSLDFKNWHLY
ncbi:MAG: hypothetical protein U0946_00515 [Patescibacteria group bacterium]|nr:hypothetical protein [Patescibacteria group bacterium]